MPAKLVENYHVSFSSALNRQHMPELNNSPAVVEISNHNFVDFLYVFENNRASHNIPPNVDLERERENRLEYMHDIVFEDGQNDKQLNKSKNDKSYSKNANDDEENLKRLVNSRSSKDSQTAPDKNDLTNLNLKDDDNDKIFSPAFMNGINYKPVCGLHQTKLYPGSRFTGIQKATGSNKNTYNVEVTIQYVDFENLYLCGHFKINGLTEEYPVLTTFFSGEMISSKYPFLTRKYDVDSETDAQFWNKLIPIKQFSNNSLFNDQYDYSKIHNSNYILMRWKETHCVKDHKIKDINGLSFAGFYYIIFSKIRGSIDGFYCSAQSEAQSLSLKHDSEKTSEIFEIR